MVLKLLFINESMQMVLQWINEAQISLEIVVNYGTLGSIAKY